MPVLQFHHQCQGDEGHGDDILQDDENPGKDRLGLASMLSLDDGHRVMPECQPCRDEPGDQADQDGENGKSSQIRRGQIDMKADVPRHIPVEQGLQGFGHEHRQRHADDDEQDGLRDVALPDAALGFPQGGTDGHLLGPLAGEGDGEVDIIE